MQFEGSCPKGCIGLLFLSGAQSERDENFYQLGSQLNIDFIDVVHENPIVKAYPSITQHFKNQKSRVQ